MLAVSGIDDEICVVGTGVADARVVSVAPVVFEAVIEEPVVLSSILVPSVDTADAVVSSVLTFIVVFCSNLEGTGGAEVLSFDFGVFFSLLVVSFIVVSDLSKIVVVLMACSEVVVEVVNGISLFEALKVFVDAAVD
uniref:Uncharacterized protein n=1 Tax=Panagrolaimus sp. PS1159 TaxID=55785 RepID=A0AC35FCZ6_9BILA